MIGLRSFRLLFFRGPRDFKVLVRLSRVSARSTLDLDKLNVPKAIYISIVEGRTLQNCGFEGIFRSKFSKILCVKRASLR